MFFVFFFLIFKHSNNGKKALAFPHPRSSSFHCTVKPSFNLICHLYDLSQIVILYFCCTPEDVIGLVSDGQDTVRVGDFLRGALPVIQDPPGKAEAKGPVGGGAPAGSSAPRGPGCV